MTVTQKSRVKNTIDEFRVGKLFMIDLAGSERAAQTKVTNWCSDVNVTMLILPTDVYVFLIMVFERINFDDTGTVYIQSLSSFILVPYILGFVLVF